MEWVQLFKENKWCFVAYTGFDNRLNTTRWYIVKSDSWSILRHQLEAFGAEAVESAHLGFTSALPYNGRPAFNTIIRGHILLRPTRTLDSPDKFSPLLKNILTPKFMKNIDLPKEILASKDYVMPNYFILLVRYPIPLGGRPFVPLEEKSSFALLEHKKTIDKSDKIEEQLSALKEDNKDRAHASDFEVNTHTFSSTVNGLRNSLSTTFLKPPLDYLCPECQQFGIHYKDACYLWQTSGHKEISVPFGPKKFSDFSAPSEDDATRYMLLHKKKK